MPIIKNFIPRRYQQTIFQSAIQNNTLIILPTGLGKTKTSILVAVERLNKLPNSKVLFLTPTKPLANQIYKEFIACTNIEKIKLFTGEILPKKRKELWDQSDTIISTPQCIENDILNKKINTKYKLLNYC